MLVTTRAGPDAGRLRSTTAIPVRGTVRPGRTSPPLPIARRFLSPLTDHASAATVDALARAMRIATYARGQTLVAQGSELGLVVGLDGYLAVRRADADGRRFTLMVMRPGQIIGLRAAADGPSYSLFDLVGLTPGRCALVRGDDVRALARRDAGLALRLFDLTAQTLARTLRCLDRVHFDDARTRFVAMLLEYEPLLTAVHPVVSRDDLAGLMGTSREMLGFVIRDLESRDIVARHGRQIQIRDRPALELLGPPERVEEDLHAADPTPLWPESARQ